MEPTHTPSAEHEEFDQLCADVEDFETLPAVSPRTRGTERDTEEETPLNEQILAGLITPL